MLTSREQDILRVQEIRQLLESRQKFFNRNWDTDSNPGSGSGDIHFAGSFKYTALNSSESSLRHSIEANFGSSSSAGSIITNVVANSTDVVVTEPGRESSESSGESEEELRNIEDNDKSSDGHYLGDTESDSSINSDGEIRVLTRRKTSVRNRRRRPKKGDVLRRWVARNLNQVGISSSRKEGAEAGKSSPDLLAPPSPRPRKKSVTFTNKSLDDVNLSLLRKVKNKSGLDPLAILAKRSYLYKAKKLDEQLDQHRIIGVTKGTLQGAREKLKNAEKCLRDVVKTTENSPLKRVDSSLPIRRLPQTKQALPPQPAELAKKLETRIAMKQAEEALKSDLNLREAFALIKIDPDPILELAQDESKEKANRGVDMSAAVYQPKGALIDRSSGIGTYPDFEDSQITKSLNRLSRLSLIYQKKQTSLVPESVKGQIVMEKMKNHNSRLLKDSDWERRRSSSSFALPPSRRRSSTATAAAISMTMTQSHYLKRDDKKKDMEGPKLALSRLKTARLDKKRGATEAPRCGFHPIEKLSGTIL